MKLITCSLILVAIGCGGGKLAPAASPALDPTPEPTVQLLPGLLCNVQVYHSVSVAGLAVQITWSSAFAAISLGPNLAGQVAGAAAGPDCPGREPLLALSSCQGDRKCLGDPRSTSCAG